jgi:transcriptional regulator GlxA family with amidase domain
VIEAFRRGARDYLKKPVNVLELQKSIECILLMKKTQRGQRRSCLMNIYYREISIEDTKKKSLPQNIHSVLRYVDKNLTSQISLEILAKIACSSKYHFCKVFKKHMDMSPLRYVALKRVKKAEELLMYSDMNISEVAWEAGFNDLSNFNKHFKKYTGITPSFYKCCAHSSEDQD